MEKNKVQHEIQRGLGEEETTPENPENDGKSLGEATDPEKLSKI